MSNPFAGIITSGLKELYTNMIDALLEDDALTRPCTLVFAGTKSSLCPNCILDGATGRSSGRYKSGGLLVFTNGQICPVCAGAGQLYANDTETVYMLVIYNKDQWASFGVKQSAVQTSSASALTISKTATYPMIVSATTALIGTAEAADNKNEYQRVGEPQFVGLGSNSYIFQLWEKVS